MNIVVVVESMFGSTFRIAEAIREGVGSHASTTVAHVSAVEPAAVAQADVLVVGGPTHSHGLSTPESRRNAAILALDSFSGLHLDPSAHEIGIREWLQSVLPGNLPGLYAAFDTRVEGLRLFTGAASQAIDAQLRRLGSDPVLPPMSFLVAADHKLITGELERASAWGEDIGQTAKSRFRNTMPDGT